MGGDHTHALPPKQVHAVNEAGQPICGAKRPHERGICQSRFVMRNGRCRMHGGESTGPMTEAGHEKLKDNQRGRTHGLYAQAMTSDDEREMYDQARDASGRDLAKETAAFMATKLANAFDPSKRQIKGAKKKVCDAIDQLVQDGELHPDAAQDMKNRLTDPSLGEASRAAAVIMKGVQVGADPGTAAPGVEGDDPNGAVQTHGLLVLPVKLPLPEPPDDLDEGEDDDHPNATGGDD